jgi:hypothetical protein
MSSGEIHRPGQFPWKLTAQTKGVQKAYRAFVDHYGPDEGVRIMLAKADENSAKRLQRERVNAVFKTGAKLPKK